MKKWIIASIIIVVSIISFNLLKSDKTNQIENSKVVDHFQKEFEFNEKYMSYKINYIIHFDSRKVQMSDLKIDAILNIEVEKKDGILLKCQLSDLKIQMDDKYLAKIYKEIYSLPFGIKVAKNGEFLDYILQIKGDTLSFLKFIFSFQTILEDKEMYTKIEKLKNQNYTSLYIWKNNKLFKTRNFKDESSKIELSNIKIIPSKNWIENMRFHEIVDGLMNGIVLFKSDIEMNVTKIAPKNISIDLNTTSNKKEFSLKKVREEALQQQIKDLNLSFSSLVNNIKKRGKYRDLKILIEYLKVNPDKIEDLYDKVVNTDNIELANKLIYVLEAIGLPESQDVLLEIATNSSLDDLKRKNAFISLGFQKNIQEYIVDDLESMRENGEDDENVMFFALSNLAANNPNSEISSRIKENLNKVFDDNKVSKTTVLLAMENIGVDKFKDKFISVLEDKTDDVIAKKEAIKALSKLKTNDVKELFIKELNNKDNEIKIHALIALSEFSSDKRVIDFIYKNIYKSVNDKALLNAMAYYLIKTAKDYPQNKEYLKKILPIVDKELAKSIIKLIRSTK